jgi:heat shock protein HslJ
LSDDRSVINSTEVGRPSVQLGELRTVIAARCSGPSMRVRRDAVRVDDHNRRVAGRPDARIERVSRALTKRTLPAVAAISVTATVGVAALFGFGQVGPGPLPLPQAPAVPAESKADRALHAQLSRLGRFSAVAINGRPMRTGTRLSVGFEPGWMHWSAGCNGLSAELALDGEWLRLGDALTTGMGCGGAVGELEERTTALFSSDPRFELRGDRLVVWGRAARVDFVPTAS